MFRELWGGVRYRREPSHGNAPVILIGWRGAREGKVRDLTSLIPLPRTLWGDEGGLGARRAH